MSGTQDIKFKLDEWTEHPHVQFTITKYPPEAHEDARLRRFKDKYIFMTGLALICGFFLICTFFIFKNPQNPLAMNSAFAIISGFAGYILRGKP